MAADPEQPVVVPHDRLDPATLRAVIERFVMREGTDYGARDVLPLDRKVEAVMRQLERREVVLVYDAATRSTNIVPADSLPEIDG